MDKTHFITRFRACLSQQSLELPPEIQETIGSYFHQLYGANQVTNLTGYTEIEQFVDFHLLDTIKILDILEIPAASSVVDVGTGAGVPGLLFRLLRPDLRVLLIETSQKKADFLKKVQKDLSLDRCQIMNARAEEMAQDGKWREMSDLAIARALSSFSQSLELTVGFVREGGRIALPRGGEEPSPENHACLEKLGCSIDKIVEYTIPGRNNPFKVVLLKKNQILSKKYPRKPGQIRKRPL